MSRIRVVLAIFVVSLAGTAPAPASTDASRLYLQAAPGDYLYWSPDPNDTGLTEPALVWTCTPFFTGGRPGAKPCVPFVVPNGYSYNLLFYPHALLGEAITWDASRPLRFHFELNVEAALPHSVHVLVNQGNGEVQSEAPATEIAPGVWEGELDTAGTIPAETPRMIAVRVRLERQVPVRIVFQAGERSWIELPEPSPVKAVSHLIAEAPAAAQPSTLTTEERAFAFNDGDWSTQSFDATLSEGNRVFEAALHERAAIVLAWLERMGDEPVYDLVHRGADARLPSDRAFLGLYRDGVRIAAGAFSVAALGVDPGTIGIDLDPLDQATDYPVRLHLLFVGGERTLGSTRWKFSQQAIAHHRTPASAACVQLAELVPVTSAATTLTLDLDWETLIPGTQRWAPAWIDQGYAGNWCGYGGNGDVMRITRSAARVIDVGAAPALDGLFVSNQDQAFTMTVRYTYAP